jgi:hypothetical protein
MTVSLDPTSPGFVGGRSYAFWRRLAGVPDGPPPVVAAPVPAISEKPPEPVATSESLAPAPG